MKYPKPTDRYDCSVLCQNFEEIEARLLELEDENSGGTDMTQYYTKTEIDEMIDDVSGLPTVTESDNGKILQVVNGVWELVELPSGGSELPSAEGVEF